MAKTRPETIGEARNFERVKNNALRFGFCAACASQLAWGHQNGFGSLRPPCADCAAMSRALPAVKPNGWRTVAGGAALSSSWAA